MNKWNKQFRKLDEVKQGGLLLLLGIVLGILVAKVFKNLYWEQLDFFDTGYFDRIKSVKIEYGVLLKYVFWKNYRIYFIFWVLCATALGVPYIVLSILYCGFQGSFFVYTILMKYGFKGILLILGYTFPHYIIYIPVMFLCLRSGYWLSTSMYRDTRLNRRGKLEKIGKHLIIIILLGGIVMIGGLLETYVGSFILRKVLVFF